MNASTAVTTLQEFDHMDGTALFCVNAGVPVEDALQRAADLMLYVEKLAAADAFSNKAMGAALIQTLSEMAKALVNATMDSGGEGQP